MLEFQNRGNALNMDARGSALKHATITIVFIAAIASVSGCTLLPLPLNTALNVGQTILDVRLLGDTGKTTSEHLASEVSGKDCKWAKIESMCMTKEEEIDYVLSKNRETITWNWLGLPKCEA